MVSVRLEYGDDDDDDERFCEMVHRQKRCQPYFQLGILLAVLDIANIHHAGS